MHKTSSVITKMSSLLLAAFTVFAVWAVPCLADSVYTNPDTGYNVIIEDEADLLTDSEERSLAEDMKAITQWGSVAFLSIDYNSSTTERYIQSYYNNTFGSSSATVFLIDMDNRNIYIYSNGKIYRTITKAYANTITDNVYTYATDGKYYECASKAFSQIYTLLDGGRIAQPMKYISNAFIALILALIINYIIVSCTVRKKKTSEKELMSKIFTQCNISDEWCQFTHQTRVYDPPSTSSSSGGGGGGGGGSSGGGGGGGGGHSF